MSIWERTIRMPSSTPVADLGLIDEYEFVVHPVVAGHGPTLFAGLQEQLDLELVERTEFRSGAVAMQYQTSEYRREQGAAS